VAGGIEIPRDRPPRDLTPRDQLSAIGIAGLAFASTLLLASCREDAAAPTLAPAPTLLVVTATAGPPPVPTPGERQRYIVREGDTLSGIAARFGVTEDAILKENPLSDRDRLFVGQELLIPPAQP
jgi:LysM repeat protein